MELLEDLVVDRRTTIKCALQEYRGMLWIGFIRQWRVKYLGSVNTVMKFGFKTCGEFFCQLNNWYFLKEGTASWS